jgi:hypothetical protein
MKLFYFGKMVLAEIVEPNSVLVRWSRLFWCHFTSDGLTIIFSEKFHGGGAVQLVNDFNFGNPPFTISSGNTDGNGYGNFEYAVPSGYYALNTKNLAEYG